MRFVFVTMTTQRRSSCASSTLSSRIPSLPITEWSGSSTSPARTICTRTNSSCASSSLGRSKRPSPGLR